jgi:hypothetical protein
MRHRCRRSSRREMRARPAEGAILPTDQRHADLHGNSKTKRQNVPVGESRAHANARYPHSLLTDCVCVCARLTDRHVLPLRLRVPMQVATRPVAEYRHIREPNLAHVVGRSAKSPLRPDELASRAATNGGSDVRGNISLFRCLCSHFWTGSSAVWTAPDRQIRVLERRPEYLLFAKEVHSLLP